MDFMTIPEKLSIYGLSSTGGKEYPTWYLAESTGDLSSRFPYIPLQKSPLWKSLEKMPIYDMSHSWTKKEITPYVIALRYALKGNEQQVEGIPAVVLEGDGGLAWRTIRRVWDLGLAYEAVEKKTSFAETIPGLDKFGTALKDASFRFFYISLFKDQLGAAVFHWGKQDEKYQLARKSGAIFKRDCYASNRTDMFNRLGGEHFMIECFLEVTSKDPAEIVFDDAQLGNQKVTQDLCEQISEAVQNAYGTKKSDVNARKKHSKMLQGMAERMVAGWNKIGTRKVPTVEEVVTELYKDLLDVLKKDEK